MTPVEMTTKETEEVALKILHTADWHLGRRFSSFAEEDEVKLTRARIEAVDQLLGIAESFTVNAILCAGDLFDDPAPAENWWRGLLRLFERRQWRDRPVFLLPGNHDPFEPNSVWAEDHPFRRALPPWVHVVDRDDYEFPLSEEAVLYAAPCRSQAGADDLALRLPRREAGDRRIRIGLVHGQTFETVGHQTNFPIALDAAEQRGLNYLALGDTHAFKELPPKSSPTVYPGAPEATTFGEKDTGFVVVVFFPRHGRPPLIQKHTVARWRWRDEHCGSLAELETLRKQDLKDSVVRLTLAMEVTVNELDKVEAILNELTGNEAAHGKAGVLQVDRTGLELNTRDTGDFERNLPDVLKSVVKRLQAEGSEPEGAIARRALYHLFRTVREAGQ
ncbi:MAG TPA: DNA repair exonuclease [Candidatus Acidoferrales bacterium]|jgi:DNA repair exonuclease SbcCD nuclease subunit|nr:DNA repair exonuclease [Candidatus Acidoferrales bacterium]